MMTPSGPERTPFAATDNASAPKRIALIAGEVSGDLLGADLARVLHRRFPGASIVGVGGDHMRNAQVDTWFDCSELAVMGLAEVLRHLPRLLRRRRQLIRRLLAWRPDVVIGIDAPDFNLGLEKRLKQAGVATVHYVSPSVWAWREKRAARIGRSADQVLCLFPMEPPIYRQYGVDARFVGHPVADQFPLQPDRNAAREALQLAAGVPTLALLPGSRLGEIRRLAPAFLGAIDLLKQRMPSLVIVAPMANLACRDAFTALGGARHCQVIDGRARDCMIAADVVLLASGTAALEGLLAKRPMVVGYRVSALTYWLVKAFGLLKTERLSLPNALAGEMLIPELLQDECRPDRLAEEVQRWFSNPSLVDALTPRFDTIHRSLRCDASERAADAISELLQR